MDNGNVLDIIKGMFSDAIIGYEEFRGDLTIDVKKDKIHPFMAFLHDDPSLKFNYLVMLTAIDFPEDKERFEIVYQLRSTENKTKLRLKTRIMDNEEVDSVTDIWHSADFDERETYDMFGIVFKNHPDLRRILMPDDWVGHPLRKEYPLKGTKEDDEYLDKHLPLGQIRRPKHTRMP